MKYIITESHFNQIIFRYLDILVSDKDVSRINPYIIIQEPNQLEYEIYDVIMEYDYSDGRLFVSKGMMNLLSNNFNLGEEPTKNFISKWFEDRYGVNVKFVE